MTQPLRETRTRNPISFNHLSDVVKTAVAQEEALQWLALRMVPGLGTLGTLKLLRKLKSPQAIFRASATELEAAGLSPGAGPKCLERLFI